MAVEQCITGPLLIAILTASEINRPSLSRCAREGHLQDGCHDVPLSSWSGTSVPRRPFHRVFRRRFSASSNAFCKPSPAHCTSLSSQHTWPAERFRSPIRRSGTRCLTSSEIRRVVLTVLSSFLRQSCLVFTNVTSALEVFKCYVLYKSSFYLLTYSYIPSSTLLITPMNQLNSLSLIFTQIFFNHLCLMPPFRAVWDDSLGIA